MAAKISEMKFAIFFVVLLTTALVNMQVMALRDMPPQETLLKMKLFSSNVLGTCNDYCNTNADCLGITLCPWCKLKKSPSGFTYSECSLLP
ncbi:fruit-specific protein [Solanum tuberosum]|uniref:Metallocarboxypeptidase inhibitor n=2 Tax=Solanum tuberosum TaxID=4113 RepID=M0ZJ50_SOLTU|nr:PREDICTED: fruit-specific protein-like [Solanum tuberosum]